MNGQLDVNESGQFDQNEAAPTTEVRVYRHGALVHRALVESEDEAMLVVDHWAELDGVTCEIDDLSVRHRAGQVFEPIPAEPTDEDYPETTDDDLG